jgi:peptide/nickel transport system permease protein
MNRLANFGLVVVGILVIVAIFAPLITSYDVGATDLLRRYQAPSAAHWFGTDATGRDVFTRVVFGTRISLQVGLTVVIVSTIVGTIIGALAGYYGGWIDRIVSGYLVNVFLAFPGLLLAIALVAFLGAGLGKLIFALCIIGWVGYARVIRAQVLKVREYDFVQAARALGAGDMRILFVHVLPNAIQPLIVQASLGMAGRGAVGSVAVIPGLGRAAARAVVGHDVGRGARPLDFAIRAARADLSRHRNRPHRACLQLHRRRLARTPRPAPTQTLERECAIRTTQE